MRDELRYMGRSAHLECMMLETFDSSEAALVWVQISSPKVLTAKLCGPHNSFFVRIDCDVDEPFSWLLLFWSAHNTNQSLWLCQKFCTVLNAL